MNNENNDVVVQAENRTLLTVSFNETDNAYMVELGKGSNTAETAFAMAVVIKCLLKDGIINDYKQMTELIDKYLTDPQFDEVSEASEEVPEEAQNDDDVN